ncbi:MAG: DNA polymerase III subunit beta [Candidatus Dojkabacteria bacterium]|nr:DNA polymerase III subunit beta [Candidatus Dojkabacteria bacterium]
MRVKLNYDKFNKALSYTIKAVANKTNIPILNNVLLETKNNGLVITTTNLEIAIQMWIPGIVDTEGSITVNARFLTDFISASKSDNVNLEIDGNILKVITNLSSGSFITMPSSDFPKTSLNHNILNIFSIDKDTLISSIDKVSFACSNDFSIGKIQQTGIFIEKQDDFKINIVGLDGFRLSLKTLEPLKINKDVFEKGIIIPAKYLVELVRILEDYQEVDIVDFFIDDKKTLLIAKFEDTEFKIRLLEGEYPDFKRIMPKDKILSIEVNKKRLEDAIRIINTFAKGTVSFKTNFDFDSVDSSIKLSAVVPEIGENQSVVPVNILLGDNNFLTAYNLRFLQDVISHIKGELVYIESNGPLAPTVIKDSSDTNFIHLLMPLRRE